jgi:hypothetical protein
LQTFTPPDHHARVVFCQQRCILSLYFVANVLFIDEARFTMDGIGKFHYTYVWMDDNPHTTMASRHQHRFSNNIWVGISGDQLLGPVVFCFIIIIYFNC